MIPVTCAIIPEFGDTIWSTETIFPGLVTWRSLCGVFLDSPHYGLSVDLTYTHAAHVGVSHFSNFLGMMPNFAMFLRRFKERCPYL